MPSIDRLPSSPSSTNRVLSSDWTGLSRHLIASFFPVHKVAEQGGRVRWEREPNSVEVQAPITDGSLEQNANWTSPFENAGIDGALATFSRLMQSGGFTAILNAMQQRTEAGSWVGQALGKMSQEVGKLEGLSGVTRLNSTQIYTGSPPAKLSFTAHFRAIADPAREVVMPVNQLLAWAAPQKLADDGVIANVVRNGPAVRSVYASNVPQVIGMRYADTMWKPMVVETLSTPLTAPRDSSGHMTVTSVQIVLSSLTAFDASDWRQVHSDWGR